MATGGAQVEVEMDLRSSLFPSWKELNSAEKAQGQSGKVSSDFLTRSHQYSSLPALCELFIRTSQTRV